jgi:hypothetical protein
MTSSVLMYPDLPPLLLCYQAMQGGHSDNHGGHDSVTMETEGGAGGHDLSGVYKGLCALSGIYLFFVMERVLTIITNLKRKHKRVGYMHLLPPRVLLYLRVENPWQYPLDFRVTNFAKSDWTLTDLYD